MLILFVTLSVSLGASSCCALFSSSKNTTTSVTRQTQLSDNNAEKETEKTEETSPPASEETTTEENTTEKTFPLREGEPSLLVSAGIVKQDYKQIALTFDSGWEFENAFILLDTLDKYNLKATFFTRGLWASDHPDIAAEIVKRGHDLQNHSLTHGHMTQMSDEEIRNEISRTTNIIKELTGFNAQLFRPPYGEYDQRMLSILNEEGYPYTIMWTIDSHDWAKELNGNIITKDYVVRRVLDNAIDGAIVLMHVGGYETINALPEIIDGLNQQGYHFVKVRDML